MNDRYLEVTYRKGRPVAAYLYLPRSSGTKAVRTEQAAPGLLVDFDSAWQPLGIEICAPGSVTTERLNAVLGSIGIAAVDHVERAPLHAA